MERLFNISGVHFSWEECLEKRLLREKVVIRLGNKTMTKKMWEQQQIKERRLIRGEAAHFFKL